MVSSLEGPGGSYIPSGNGIEADIATLQAAYTAQQANLATSSTLFQKYQTASNNLNAAIAKLQTDEQNGASPSQISADQSNLSTMLSQFQSASSSYESAVSSFQILSACLSNALEAEQQSLDSQANSAYEQAISDFNGIIDPTLYQRILNADATRQADRTTLNNALQALLTNTISTASERSELSQANDNVLIALAQAWIANPSSPDLSSGSAYGQAVAAANAIYDSSNVPATGTLATLLNARSSLTDQLNSAITTYSDDLNNPDNPGPPDTTGLVTLLQEAQTQAQTSAQNFIAAEAASKAAMDTLVTTNLMTAQTSDMQAQTQHAALFPTPTASTIAEIESSGQSAINSQLNALGGKSITILGVEIDLPELPGSNQVMSLFDLMRFAVEAQQIGNDLSVQASNADSELNVIRMEIWQLLIQLQNSAFNAILSQMEANFQADVQYNAQVDETNSATFSSESQAVQTFNAQLSNINQVITNYNTNVIGVQNANGVTITNDFNTAAQQATSMLNATNDAEPNDINTNNIFSQGTTITPTSAAQDPSVPVPTPANPPPPAPYPETIPNLPPVSALTVTPPAPGPPPPTQAQIDAYNAQIEAVDDALAPVQSELAALNPPITYPIPLLYYDQDIAVRTVNTQGFNFTAVNASLQTLYNIINNQIQIFLYQNAGVAPTVNVTPPADQPVNPPTNPGNVGSGTAFAGADATNAGTLGQALDQLLTSQNYADTVETLITQSITLGTLQAGIAPIDTVIKNYSVYGLTGDDLLSEQDVALLQQAAQQQTDSQLYAIATQFLDTATNIPVLTQYAQTIVASLPNASSFSSAELSALTNQVISSLQLSFATLAAIAATSVGGNSSPAQAEALLGEIFAGGTSATSSTTATATATATATSTPTTANTTISLLATPVTATATAATATAATATSATATAAPSTATPATSATATSATATAAPVAAAPATAAPATTASSTAAASTAAPATAAPATAAPATAAPAIATAAPATSAPVTAPPPTVSLGQAFTGSNVSQATQQNLQTLINALVAPQGSANALSAAQLNQLITQLQQAGITLPTTLSPQSPDFLAAVLDETFSILPPSGQQAFLNQLSQNLSLTGLTTDEINGFFSEVQEGVGVGEAFNNAVSLSPTALISGLNIDLSTIPPAQLAQLQDQVNTTLSSLTILSPEDKLKLVVAAATGQISSTQAQGIIADLAAIQSGNGTIQTSADLLNIFLNIPIFTASGPVQQALQSWDQSLQVEAQASKDDSRKRDILNDSIKVIAQLLQNIKQAAVQQTSTVGDTRQDTQAQSIVTQSDFYQKSLDLILNLANVFVKNFSISTREVGKGGQLDSSSTNIMLGG